ncbi:uncharacterized protein ELE39_002034 [Cryptosporidium sp. chipmunk genotype I]|uniref:uncharacterized protein n=1 Tax=Cryptosporidium sp. chipmunk genotype I TaxID=1280935 RepID=UPI003519FBF2|nr:hypothetical protein ELE39_002034 [Cryptosporidium sp. chipmunk genotype I]
MDKVSKLGYLQVNQDELNKFEKEEKLDIKQELLIESQFIYFNSTNEGDTLIYNKLSNSLFRINSNEIFEYQLPKLYELEFSYKPLHLIMYINTKEETNNYIIFLAYIQQDEDNAVNSSNQKLLVIRKIHLEKQMVDDQNNNNYYKWNEMDYIETKIHIENNQILRGIIWWEDSPNQSSIFDEQCYPSILMITNSKLILFSLKEHVIHPIWQINEHNLQFWYNMEFQSLLLQTGPNILTPYININMNQQQKPIKLQPLELILNSEIRQEDIFLLNIYQNLYCVHIDYSNKRISLRDLFNQDSSDLVLDIGETFQEFTLLVVDNVIVVINLHGKKLFGLFDIKLVKKNNSKNISKSNNANDCQDKQLGNDSNNNICHYYMVPTLFSDELNDNTIICLYDNNKNDMYMKSLKKIKSHHLNNYHIILVNSSCNIVIKLDVNKIQYSRLNLCNKLLIDNIINIEKMDILPFISNRNLLWDDILLEKLKFLVNKEIDNNNNNSIKSSCPKVFTLLMEIIKVKIDMKVKINQEYYEILLELILYIKRESLLQYVLQYHIFEDSNKILKELYNMYLFNRNKDEFPSAKANQETRHVRFNSKVLDKYGNNQTSRYFKLENISWLEQICLDTAYRMNNIKILIDILIYRKEYRRAIKILRDKSEQKVIININNKEISIKMIILTLSKNNQACKYPIYNILYKLGNDIEFQENDPNLFRDVIKEIRNWINEYFEQVKSINDVISNNRRAESSDIVEKYNFSIIGRPNINKCNIWLPELINMKDLNGSDELMNSRYTGNNNDHDHSSSGNIDEFEKSAISDSDSEFKSSLKNSNYSTFESIYVSATESNETFIITNSGDKQSNNNGVGSGISSSSSDCCNENLLKNSTERNLIRGNNSGKSPLLHHEPGFISSSSIYINNSSDSSSYSSDTSSSFNSYE